MIHRERLLGFCRSQPHVTEDVKWGADLCFSIGGKMFAVFGLEGGATFSCKATEEAFHALTGGSDGGIVPAPYAARYFWIAVKKAGALSDAQAEALIGESYELVLAGLPAKVRQSLGVVASGESPAKNSAKKAAAKKPANRPAKAAAKKPAKKAARTPAKSAARR